MNINQAFPSKYLKASDLNGGTVTVTIANVELEQVGQGAQQAQKLVAYFEGKSKGMVLNKTNATMIARIAGSEDTEEWAGVAIRLVVAEVEFQGEAVSALRVREPQKPKAAAKPKAEPVAPLDDEEIPF